MQQFRKYDVFELILKGRAEDNHYLSTELATTFTCKKNSVKVTGFYDGDGNFKFRFMPNVEGQWLQVGSIASSRE
jgi:hypothetical protein